MRGIHAEDIPQQKQHINGFRFAFLWHMAASQTNRDQTFRDNEVVSS